MKHHCDSHRRECNNVIVDLRRKKKRKLGSYDSKQNTQQDKIQRYKTLQLSASERLTLFCLFIIDYETEADFVPIQALESN
jgi:hypothetical protein